MFDPAGASGMSQIAKGIGQGLNSFANASARAASRANGVSKQAQKDAATINQASADNANLINSNTLAGQYGYNAAQAALANDYSTQSWERAAKWNEEMFERQMEFNAEEAAKQRRWLMEMDNTKYVRAMNDMKNAGLNPVLASGGISVGSGGGGAASVSSPSMGAMSGQGGSGGLLGANDASVGGYTGQMEYMGGMLGLLSAAIGGISSAMKAMGGMGDFGKELGSALGNIFTEKTYRDNVQSFSDFWKQGRENQKNKSYTPNYRNGIDWNMKSR